MSVVAPFILSTVNAPYGTSLSASELAIRICKSPVTDDIDAAAFSFYSDVSEELQRRFIDDMQIDPETAATVAQQFSELAGFTLPLAKAA